MELYKNEDFKTESVNGREVLVPEDWSKIYVKDYSDIEFKNGFAFKTSEMLTNGTFPIIKIGNIQDNKIIIKDDNKYTNIDKKEYKIEKGDLILGLSGAQAGKSGIFNLDIDCYLNQRNLRIRTKNTFFNISFETSIKKPLIETARSMGIPNISDKDLQNLEIILPNKEEQTRIATVLTKQEELIEAKEKLISIEEKKKTFLQQEILYGRMRINENGKFYNNEDFKTELVNGRDVLVPEEWEVVKITDISDINFGKRIVKSRNEGNEFPVFGGGKETFRTGTHNRENVVVIARFAMSKKCTSFISGKFYLNDSGFSLLPKDIDNNFLNKKILASNNEIYRLGRGAAQINMDMDDFRKFNLAIPNKEEQTRIATVLTNQDESIELMKKDLEIEKKKFKHLQQELLSGRIRIKESQNEKSN